MAMLWEAHGDGSIKCQVCAHGCHLKEGKHGICGVRVNSNGEMVTLVNDVVTAVQLDPVEKKPLYHFLPGSKTFSIGSAGCNFRCIFCQNSEIAHVHPRSTLNGRRLTPETIVRLAKENKAPSIAFTYNEPTVFFELAYAGAGLAKADGLKTILVSNGFMSNEFLQSMSKRIDAANIDLKGFTDEFYHKYCGGRLQPVLENLVTIKKMGWWLEVTTLLIPGVNDSAVEITNIANFIKDSLGVDTPWHISAFHGAAQMSHHPSTPLSKLEEAWNIGKNTGLEYVYVGNAHTSYGANTHCPVCSKLLIERHGYRTRVFFKNGTCPSCGAHIAGVWN